MRHRVNSLICKRKVQSTRRSNKPRCFAPIYISKISKPKTTVFYIAAKKALNRVCSEAILILLLALPLVITSIIMTFVAFLSEYAANPWGAVYTYRPLLGEILSSTALTIALAALLDLFDKRRK